MTTLSGITNSPSHSASFVVQATSETVYITLSWSPTQSAWYLSFTYGSLVVNGLRISTGVNLLRQWRNLLPFGIAIVTLDGYDPKTLNAFSSGGASIYVLTSSEVATAEANVFANG